MKKLVCENLQEYRETIEEVVSIAEPAIIDEALLNQYKESEGIIDEGLWDEIKRALIDLNNAYAKLNKEDEKAVRQFALNVALKTYVGNKEAGQKSWTTWAQKKPIADVKAWLETAAKDKFLGRPHVAPKEGKLVATWTPSSEVTLQSAFAAPKATTGA